MIVAVLTGFAASLCGQEAAAPTYSNVDCPKVGCQLTNKFPQSQILTQKIEEIGSERQIEAFDWTIGKTVSNFKKFDWFKVFEVI